MMTAANLTGKSPSHLVDILVENKTFAVHQAVKEDLQRLLYAAKQAGFLVHIASGYRDFERQRNIWNKKFIGELALRDHQNQLIDINNLSEDEKVWAILHWSALPGASRHHWGTDFDLFAANLLPPKTSIQLEPWEYLQGHQTPFYQWLSRHAPQYNFFFPYNKYNGGVAAEPWHLSHLPTASLCLSELSLELLQAEITGLQGQKFIFDNLASIYQQFVLNINA